MLLTGRSRDADHVQDAAAVTATALLNCLVREVALPDRQVRHLPGDGAGRLLVGLPRAGVTLRLGLARPPSGLTHRLEPPYEEQRGGAWVPASWERLADLVAGELELESGRGNPEFLPQVRDSHAALAALLAARSATAPSADPFLESEQSLVAGHRFHPSPKSRQGDPADWLRYAPETRSRFRLHWLAVREEVLVEEGDPTAFAALEKLVPAPPPGYRPLPAHPWQLCLLADDPAFRAARETELIRDLGACVSEAVPTSSVRTAYVPDADLFCKFSLDMRITNCVRKNAWYELQGSTVLDRLLRPVFAALGVRFDGCVLLSEPAHRTVSLTSLRLHEGLGVILRQGVGGLAGAPLLAGALADPYGTLLADLPAMSCAEGALAWWDGYAHRVVRPVLHAYLEHGVVLEPHLQNVLMVMDDDGMPVQAVFRDLEGTKLVEGRWEERLAGVPRRVREALTYDAPRAWNRVVYCLLVNHLAEVLAAVADLYPSLERELWRTVRRHVEATAADPAIPDSPGLRALLAGVPLPAKTNLRTRWSRAADRAAGYVPVPNPLAN